MNKRDVSKKFKIGEILDVEKYPSSQNNVYKLICKDKEYVLKEFSVDAIGSNYSLGKRREQARVSRELNKRGIKCIVPISISSKNFFRIKKKYYVLYPAQDVVTLEDIKLSKDLIKKLASTQAKIHKVKIPNRLVSHNRKVMLDIDKYIEKFNNTNEEIADLLIQYNDIINTLVEKCNEALPNIKKNLCISHNDYKKANILVEKDNICLVDFDAMGLSNPTAAMIESAYNFSKEGNKINYKIFEEYFREYRKAYGKIKDDFLESIYTSMNGKLGWFNYLLSKGRSDSKDMIETLVVFYKNIDKILYIMNKVDGE